MKLPASAAASICALIALPATASAAKPFDFELAPRAAAGASAAGAGTLSPRLATKHRFNLLGMRWRGRAVPEIGLRVRRPGRGWSRWQELEAHDDHNPDPGGTGRTLACDEWNDQVVDAMRTFRDEHRSNGPEPAP